MPSNIQSSRSPTAPPPTSRDRGQDPRARGQPRLARRARTRVVAVAVQPPAAVTAPFAPIDQHHQVAPHGAPSPERVPLKADGQLRGPLPKSDLRLHPTS